MIVFSSTQAKFDSIGRRLKCKAKCVFNCIGVIFPPQYCIKDCEKDCEKLSSNPCL